VQHDLIGYLLGCLGVEEITLVEQTIAADGAVRSQLELLRVALLPLESLRHDSCACPDGLALRTCEKVRQLRSE
jgi:anti-sigma-K factor RskA